MSETPSETKLQVQPSLFVSHGAPNLALIHESPYHSDLKAFISEFESPKAIVVVSAHWATGGGVQITSHPRPPTIYDFSGFPRELYQVPFTQPGDPALAQKILTRLQGDGILAALDPKRGFDHGTWVPLKILYPDSTIPVVQLSIPLPFEPRDLLKMGRALATLRNEGVAMIGSGGAVHNLSLLKWDDMRGAPEKWALDFETWVMDRLVQGDVTSLAQFEELGPNIDMAHPSHEHFLPLLFTLGASVKGDKLSLVHRGYHYRSLSMLSFSLRQPPQA